MTTLKWYKRDPDAALGGMMELTLEERGAYNTILDLIYSHAGNLIDDDRFLAGWMRCDIRVWKRIKSRLIELGKIEIKDGLVTNFRATSELDVALGRALSVSELNRIKGIKSGIARKKNNGLAEPRVEPKMNTATARIREDTTESIETHHSMLENESVARASARAEEPQIAFAAWNKIAAELDLPSAQFFTPTRRQKIAKRLKECGGLSGWNAALEKIRSSSFCRGGGDRGWRIDLDALLQPKTFTHLMEGSYDDNKRRKSANGSADRFLDTIERRVAERKALGIPGTATANNRSKQVR